MACKDCEKPKYWKILNGWRNYMFPNKHTEQVAKERAAVCAGCTSNVVHVCKECICPLAALTRSMESKCKLEKWKQ